MALLVKRFRQSSFSTFAKRRSFFTRLDYEIPLKPLEEAVRRVAAGPADVRPDHYKLVYQWAQSLYCGKNKSLQFKTIPHRLGWFTHGLWAHTANVDHFCSKNPQPLLSWTDLKAILGLNLMHLLDLWPDLKDCANPLACLEFCLHQWNKHGRHTGFTFKEYIELTLKLTLELIEAHPDGPNSCFGVQMDTPMTIASVHAALSIPFRNWRLGSVFQCSSSEVEVHGRVGTKNEDNVAELRIWIDSLFGTTIKSRVRFSGSCNSKRPVMAQIPSAYPSKGPDKLSTSRNSMYVGAYQAAISHSNIPDLSSEEILDRNYIIYRSCICLGSYQRVIDAVDPAAPLNLQAVKLLALYFWSPKTKEMAISKTFEWLGDPFKRHSPTFCLIAGIIFLNEQNYNQALKVTEVGGTMELYAFNVHILLKMNQVNAATNQLVVMRRIDRDHVLTQLADGWVNLAVGGTSTGKALTIFNLLSAKYGMSRMLQQGLITCNMDMGNFDTAETLLLQALKQGVKHPEIVQNLVYCRLICLCLHHQKLCKLGMHLGNLSWTKQFWPQPSILPHVHSSPDVTRASASAPWTLPRAVFADDHPR
ncbi:Coatomer subunit epsilon-1 [Striga hermonthica]|uniref:Coatomer subunit epsilon-1 n=1 Tax=Striga hermonthica TaxID=68872 RepID=A0A9N7N294_STRHE|nr:Coatomer subunit epsilon-1 [Striga hermonthica]